MKIKLEEYFYYISIYKKYNKVEDMSNLVLKTLELHHHIRPWLKTNINHILLTAILNKHINILFAFLYIIDKKIFSEKEIISVFNQICDFMIIKNKLSNVSLDYICLYKKLIDKDSWRSYLSD